MNLILALVGLFLIIAQGFMSMRAGTLFNESIVNEQKGWKFLSFASHGAMWADLLILCPVIYIAGGYSGQWSWGKIALFATLSLVASTVMNLVVYPKMATPSCHYSMEMKITPAGWGHLLFMALGVFAILLFYLGTPEVDSQDALIVSMAIGVSLPFQTIVPDLRVKRHIDLLGALQLLPLCALVGFGYFNVTELHWITF